MAEAGSLRRARKISVTLIKERKMNRDETEDQTIYKVVVNHEEQYSIWPADRENALGWSDAGKSGSKAECLAYIKEVWTDMRPLSLRRKMEQAAESA
jgi:MbtH protein